MVNNGVKPDGVRQVYEPVSGDGRKPDLPAAAGWFSQSDARVSTGASGLGSELNHTFPIPELTPGTSPRRRWLMSAGELRPVGCGATAPQRLPGR